MYACLALEDRFGLYSY